MALIAVRSVKVLGEEYAKDEVIPPSALAAMGPDRVEQCKRARLFAERPETRGRPRTSNKAKES